MSDLVEALRSVEHWSVHDCYMSAPLLSKAADRIEALELALKEQVGECFVVRCEMCMRHESLLDDAQPARHDWASTKDGE